LSIFAGCFSGFVLRFEKEPHILKLLMHIEENAIIATILE
jgi:hypothetical protein